MERVGSRLAGLMLLALLASVLVLAGGCKDEETGGDCPASTTWNGQECVRDRVPGPQPGDGNSDADGAQDGGDVADESTGDAGDGSIGDADGGDASDGVGNTDWVDGADGTDWSDFGGDTTEPPVGECGVGETPTTLRGVVTIPSGALPLPEVIVYVAEDNTLQDIQTGASCEACGVAGLSGRPVVWTETDIRGRFELTNVPGGDNVTLVVEVGKWRRVSVLPHVERCAVTNVPQELTRLPRNRNEGSIPQFAVTTGGCDATECLLRKIGIDDSEFTPESGEGAVHLFHGQHGTRRFASNLNNGANFVSASDWWRSLDRLLPYDIVVNSCECNEARSNKPDVAMTAVRDFADRGGRLFLTHFHYAWLRHGPADFQSVATWNPVESALVSPTTARVDVDFPKGQQLAEWMYENGVTDTFREFSIREVRSSVDQLNENVATRWAWIEPRCLLPLFCPSNLPAQQPQYISFNAPVNAHPDDQCGRVVHSDIHVSGGDRSSDGTRENSGAEVQFPNGCTSSGLTDQEAALVFMLFDLARCVVPDKI